MNKEPAKIPKQRWLSKLAERDYTNAHRERDAKLHSQICLLFLFRKLNFYYTVGQRKYKYRQNDYTLAENINDYLKKVKYLN